MKYFTPARAKVRDAVQFCDRMGIECFKGDVFRTFNVSHRQEVASMLERLDVVIAGEGKMTGY